MKASDYIVEYLFRKGIEDFFGFQGTMIAHFVDSVGKHPGVRNHVCINEQGAAFAAVGYAKTSGKCGLAYATSGPGAINLMSGIADAYYDSAPVIFLTGQLNTNEYTKITDLRQQGFQQTDVVSMAESVTKYCTQITRVEDIPAELAKAYEIAMSGRKGPVLLDLPMNLQRFELEADPVADAALTPVFEEERAWACSKETARTILSELLNAKKPLLVLGNGIAKDEKSREQLRSFVETLQIPVVTSLLGRDILPGDHPCNMGMIGSAYGHRYANLISGLQADLILSIGASLCPRQVSLHPENFAPEAKILRVDIDPVQLKREVHPDEIQYLMDGNGLLDTLMELLAKQDEEIRKTQPDRARWIATCEEIRSRLIKADEGRPELRENETMRNISRYVADDTVLSVDIGQHQMWTASSFILKEKQRLITSGGHGAMGFSLPAAIGAYYATKKPVTVICGDGSLQMNIQEFQWLVKDQIPVTILVMNNNMLGLIKQQQDASFGARYYGASTVGGYCAPDFEKVAMAYGIESCTVDMTEIDKIAGLTIPAKGPQLIQIRMDENTGAFPKTVFGEPMYNQKPYISEDLIRELSEL